MFVLLLCISCNNNSKKNNESAKDASNEEIANENSIVGNFSNQQTIKFDSAKIATFFSKYSQLNSIKKELDSFYHNRQYVYAWYEDNGLIDQADN